MIFKDVPDDFKPRFEVVSCYVESDGKLLFLHRLPHKSEGGRWGVPAGKVDAGEAPREALMRELYEETGIQVEEDALEPLSSIHVRHSDYDFVYHMYRVRLDVRPDVVLNPEEHAAYRWETPESAFGLELVTDLDECIRMHY